MNQVVFGYLTGAAVANIWSTLPGYATCVVLAMLAIGLLCCRRWALSGMLIASIITAWAGHHYLSRQNAAGWGEELTITARILAVNVYQDHLKLIVNSRRHGALRLNWYQQKQPPPVIGSTWRFQAALRRPTGYANPGGFDYLRYLVAHEVALVGVIHQGARIAPSPWLQRWRQQWQQQLVAQLSGVATRRWLMALAMGRREQLTAADWQLLQHTGTSHLFAISGLHLGLIYLAVMLLVQLPCRLLMLFPALPDLDGQRWSRGCALIFSAFYCWFSGAAVASQRALLMLALWTLVSCCRWRVSVWRIVALTALILLLMQPLMAFDNSFWLSLFAVTSLLWLSQRLPAQWSRWRQLLVVQCGLWLLMMPLTIVLFGGTSLVAVIVNVLLVPVVGWWVLGWSLVGVVSGWLWPWRFADIAMQACLAGMHWFAGWPAIWVSGTTAKWLLWAGLVVTASVILWQRLPKRWLLAPCAGAYCLLWWWRTPPPVFIDILDVGQGLTIVVHQHDYTMLYDTGPAYPSGFNTADTVLLPYFRHEGITQLDTVIISHSDNDHAGALPYLVAGIAVRRLLGGSTGTCHAGVQSHDPNVVWRALWPHHFSHYNNDNSCVISLTLSGHHILFTGDISHIAEYALVKAGLRAHDLVMIPHHGSASSSSRVFVRRQQARWAVVSRGIHNIYHLPNRQVIQRYQQFGQVADTALAGRIRFIPGPDGHWQVLKYRRDEQPRWYDRRSNW